VLGLVELLRKERIEVWFDHHELQPGMQISDRVTAALDKSDGLISVLSRNSIDSRWVQYEGSYFSARNKPIIPIVLDNVESARLREIPFLGDRLYVDLSREDTRPDALRRLIVAIEDAKN
jgi:hypothetical protein